MENSQELSEEERFMNRIIDLDIIDDFTLQLTYESGLSGKFNFFKYRDCEVFNNPKKFQKFALLPTGDLEWLGGERVTSLELLDKLVNISSTEKSNISGTTDILMMAFQDAVRENRPQIIQAALRAMLDKHGVANVANMTNGSRTSIYKSLNENTNVSMSTVINLAHSVMEIEKKEKEIY